MLVKGLNQSKFIPVSKSVLRIIFSYHSWNNWNPPHIIENERYVILEYRNMDVRVT